MSTIDIKSAFSAHVLDEKSLRCTEHVRGAARFLAWVIQEFVPAGPNQTLAIRALEDCVMRANKGIAEACPIKLPEGNKQS